MDSGKHAINMGLESMFDFRELFFIKAIRNMSSVTKTYQNFQAKSCSSINSNNIQLGSVETV